MIYNHPSESEDGILRLVLEENMYSNDYDTNSDNQLLTIAWNRGETQIINLDGEQFLFAANEMVVFNSNQAFHFNSAEKIVFWQFNKPFYCIIDHDSEVSCVGLLFFGNRGTPRICLSKVAQTQMDLLVRVFLEEFQEQNDNLKTEMLRVLLKRLIVKLTRTYKIQQDFENEGKTELDLIRNFNLLVEQHYKQFHQVQDYADLLFKSPKTISNVFTKNGDKSPLQIIHARIILEAKRLLMFTSKTTKDISATLGFTDIPSFSRFFKKNCELPPSQFRKSYENSQNGTN